MRRANHREFSFRARLLTVAILLVAVGGCDRKTPPADGRPQEDYPAMREQMVTRHIEARGIRDPAVLNALRTIPRELFVPEADRRFAYRDGPLPIGFNQTISQPYIVALMTELLRPRPDMRVLEVGTGSGYQAAVLAECVGEVFTIEILPQLAKRSEELLIGELGYQNVNIRAGDGFDGWPEEAPFDAIIVTAAPPNIPQPLLDQLGLGGRLVIPVGRNNQDLLVVTRTEDGFQRETKAGVRFVPMTGKIEEETP